MNFVSDGNVRIMSMMFVSNGNARFPQKSMMFVSIRRFNTFLILSSIGVASIFIFCQHSQEILPARSHPRKINYDKNVFPALAGFQRSQALSKNSMSVIIKKIKKNAQNQDARNQKAEDLGVWGPSRSFSTLVMMFLMRFKPRTARESKKQKIWVSGDIPDGFLR